MAYIGLDTRPAVIDKTGVFTRFGGNPPAKDGICEACYYSTNDHRATPCVKDVVFICCKVFPSRTAHWVRALCTDCAKTYVNVNSDPFMAVPKAYYEQASVEELEELYNTYYAAIEKGEITTKCAY